MEGNLRFADVQPLRYAHCLTLGLFERGGYAIGGSCGGSLTAFEGLCS